MNSLYSKLYTHRKDELESLMVGKKAVFNGVPDMYYPMFTDVGELARNSFTIGDAYEIESCHVYSSWCAIKLKGIDGQFHASFFRDE